MNDAHPSAANTYLHSDSTGRNGRNDGARVDRVLYAGWSEQLNRVSIEAARGREVGSWRKGHHVTQLESSMSDWCEAHGSSSNYKVVATSL